MSDRLVVLPEGWKLVPVEPTEEMWGGPGMGLEKLCELWEKLGDVPVTEDGCLEEPFEHFNRGVDREEVWRWLETQNPGFVVGDMLQGISPLQQ